MELLKKCGICKEFAKNLCLKCNNYFCESCFKFVHDKPSNQDHKKENIDPFIPIDIKCQFHPEYPIKIFCVDEMGKILLLIFINFRALLCFLSL